MLSYELTVLIMITILTRAQMRTGPTHRAFLSVAFLTGAFLTRAFLTRAFLTGAFLTRAFLSVAFLTGAFLTGAFLAQFSKQMVGIIMKIAINRRGGRRSFQILVKSVKVTA